MQLAYLLAKAVDNGSWSGGLLVTDERGLPVDFRYVEPIRPSRLQELIYGGALKRYLILDAIAGTLLKAANPQVDWVFVGDPVLLELDGHNQGRFVAVGNGEERPMSAVGEWRVKEPGVVVVQVTAVGPPTVLSFNAKDEAATEEVAKDLGWLAEQHDFVEPLSRVGAALKEICHGETD